MVMRVKADIDAMRKTLERWERQQIPYAAKVALDTVAFDTRKFVIDRLWPNAFPQMHNRRFPSVLFRVGRATKTRLSSSVFDSLGRDWLGYHITGGTRAAQRGSNRAVPVQARRTASGRTRTSDKPRALRNSFRANFKGRGDAIYQRVGKSGALKLMYVLEPSVKIAQAFPLFRKGYDYADTVWPRAFEAAIARALR